MVSTAVIDAQPAGFNYDESKVPKYELPELLVSSKGQKITTAEQWTTLRRPELLELYRTHVYGRSPGKPEQMSFEVVAGSEDRQALGGTATRKLVRIHLGPKTDGQAIDLLIYKPNNVAKAPVFLGYNFKGNHSVHADPGIPLPRTWMPNNREEAVVDNRATEKGRATEASRWQLEKVLGRGYALATIYYGDIEPDHAKGHEQGIRGWYAKNSKDADKLTWGAIGAWAWGLSRAMDYIESDPQLDAKRVAVIGHSRLGKTSLWAGAQDERFAIVISNNSGEGGAAITRRQFGETIERINTSFPHWFTTKFKDYNGKENDLPVDQHMLIALAAPRPVYVASAEEDLWADPRGEFLAAHAATPVYQLFGKKGIDSAEMPELNKPVGESTGYHIRTGKHDVTAYDWDQYLNFADKHFGKAGAR